jgi:hypothetical protein
MAAAAMDDQGTNRMSSGDLRKPHFRLSLRTLLLLMALCCVLTACLRAYLDWRHHRIKELSERLVHLEARQELLIGMMNSYQYHEGHTSQRIAELAKINAEVVEIKNSLGKKITALNLKKDLPATYLRCPAASNRQAAHRNHAG